MINTPYPEKTNTPLVTASTVPLPMLKEKWRSGSCESLEGYVCVVHIVGGLNNSSDKRKRLMKSSQRLRTTKSCADHVQATKHSVAGLPRHSSFNRTQIKTETAYKRLGECGGATLDKWIWTCGKGMQGKKKTAKGLTMVHDRPITYVMLKRKELFLDAGLGTLSMANRDADWSIYRQLATLVMVLTFIQRYTLLLITFFDNMYLQLKDLLQGKMVNQEFKGSNLNHNLQLGRIGSGLVTTPTTPSVPPTEKQLSELFQPLFDEDEEFPPDVHPHLFENSVTNEFDSEASTSGTVNVNPTQQNNPPIVHEQKWTKDHPLENVIRDLNQPLGGNCACSVSFYSLLESSGLQDQVDGIWRGIEVLSSVRAKASQNMTIFQMDVKTAFLNGELNEVVYAHVLGGDNYPVSQNPRGIFINQSKYALEILKKYGLDSSASVDTPMVEKMKLDEDRQGKLVDPTRFCGMVGSLMYLSASRPDIVFAVCMCARYQAKPTEKHLHAIKRIFRYLKGTIHMGLWYSKDSGFALRAFADADYAGCQDTRRSTSGSA
ncbi:hypothetical protein Tco_0763680 [Tanacetum coccineum]